MAYSRRLDPPDRAASAVALRLTPALIAAAAIGAAAGVLRWANLAALPLQSAEARAALDVHQFWQPGVAPIPAHPLYFTLTALTTPVLGLSDATVRLIPATAGWALVLLPWLLRRWLGTAGALTAMALLAASPLQALVARTAGGDALALLCAGALAVAWVNGRRLAAAVALGLGLTTAPLFYSALLALCAAALLGRQRPFSFSLPPGAGRLWAAAAAVAAVLGSTLLLWHPAALGGAVDLPIAWLRQFALRAEQAGAWSVLLRHNPTLLLLLGPAIGYALWRPSAVGRALLGAGAAAAVLGLAQAGQPAVAALIEWPAAALIGLAANSVAVALERQTARRTAVVTIVWGLLALVQIGRYTRLTVDDVNQAERINQAAPLILVALLLLVLLLTAIAFTNDPARVLLGALAGFTALALYLNWGTAWRLTRETGNDPRAGWVQTGTHPGVRALATTLRQTSFQLRRAPADLSIVSTVDDPALHWYLRDFHDLRVAPALAPGAMAEALIAPVGAALSPDGTYTSTEFSLSQTNETRLPPANLSDRLRRWFYGDTVSPLTQQRVTLWLRLSN